MDLKTFIAETLTAIVEGVAEAQTRVVSTSPTAAVSLLDRMPQHERWPNPNATNVDFDVAVTTSQELSAETGAKGGLKIYVVSGGVEGKDAERSKSEAASRVRFSVPVHLPVMHSSLQSDEYSAETSRVRGHTDGNRFV